MSAQRIGRFLVIGQRTTLRIAAGLRAGRGRALADDPLFRDATRGLPAGRVLDGFVTAAGMRLVLAPQAGLLGAVGTLLDQAGLRGGAFAAEARPGGARLTVRRVLDPAARRARPAGFTPFTPTLAREAPAGTLLFAELRGLGPAAQRLLGLAAASDEGLATFIGRVRRELRAAGGDLEGRLGRIFDGETAVTIAPGLPPRLTLVARVRDEAAARRTMADLQAPLANLFAPPPEGGGLAPTFDEENLGGVDVFRLRLDAGIDLAYAVTDGRA